MFIQLIGDRSDKKVNEFKKKKNKDPFWTLTQKAPFLSTLIIISHKVLGLLYTRPGPDGRPAGFAFNPAFNPAPILPSSPR